MHTTSAMALRCMLGHLTKMAPERFSLSEVRVGRLLKFTLCFAAVEPTFSAIYCCPFTVTYSPGTISVIVRGRKRQADPGEGRGRERGLRLRFGSLGPGRVRDRVIV